jgi:hypothetical protein
MMKNITFIILLTHGIGHLQGVVVGLGFSITEKWNTHSWIIGNQRVLCLITFLLTSILGIASAISYKNRIIRFCYWECLAVTTAVVSTISIVVFPNAFAGLFHKVGAIVINILIFYSIFYSAHWPPQIFNDLEQN